MDINTLTQMLADEKRLDQLSLTELDQWIEAYPYVYRLHEVRAARTGEAGSEHVLNLSGAGWMSDDYDRHEFIALESKDTDTPEVDTKDVEEVVPTAIAVDNTTVQQVTVTFDEEEEVMLDEPVAEVEQEVAAHKEVSMEEKAAVEGDAVDHQLTAGVVAAGAALAGVVVADEDSDIEVVEDNTLDKTDPVEKELEALKVEEVIDDQVFMPEMDEGEPTAPSEIPDIDKPSLSLDQVEIDQLSSNDQVLMMSGKDEKRAAKKKSKKKSKKKEKSDVAAEETVATESAKKTKKKKETDKKKKKTEKKGKASKKSKKKDKKSKKVKKEKSKSSVKEGKVSNYAEWLLAQQQINEKRKKKKGKSAKKKKKVVKEAMRSLHKRKGIVSEPLAELLVAQGHVNQAILMYQELRLNYPKKSTYFAGRIKELKNNT